MQDNTRRAALTAVSLEETLNEGAEEECEPEWEKFMGAILEQCHPRSWWLVVNAETVM